MFDVLMTVLNASASVTVFSHWKKNSKQGCTKQSVVQVDATQVLILKCHFNAYSSYDFTSENLEGGEGKEKGRRNYIYFEISIPK